MTNGIGKKSSDKPLKKLASFSKGKTIFCTNLIILEGLGEDVHRLDKRVKTLLGSEKNCQLQHSCQAITVPFRHYFNRWKVMGRKGFPTRCHLQIKLLHVINETIS